MVTLLWQFSKAWDTVKHTLEICFICPLVVIDPTDLLATEVQLSNWATETATEQLSSTPEFLFQALCMSISNLYCAEDQPLDGNKADLFVSRAQGTMLYTRSEIAPQNKSEDTRCQAIQSRPAATAVDLETQCVCNCQFNQPNDAPICAEAQPLICS